MIVKTAIQQQWTITSMTNDAVTVITSADVDGVLWYTVNCRTDVANWVRQQDSAQWVEHINYNMSDLCNTFDMHSELYAYLKLTWGQ